MDVKWRVDLSTDYFSKLLFMVLIYPFSYPLRLILMSVRYCTISFRYPQGTLTMGSGYP